MRFEWPGIAISWPLPVPLLFIFLISMIQLLLCTLKLVSHVQTSVWELDLKGSKLTGSHSFRTCSFF